MHSNDRQTGIPLRMVGEDGNAFFILGRAAKALRQAGLRELVPEFQAEATADDYDHLLRTVMAWFDVDGDDDEEEAFVGWGGEA